MTEIHRRRVYRGPAAIRAYLHPRNHPPLPLVELPAELNPLAADGVRLFAKCMFALPLGNVKSLPAFAMIEDAARRGRLAGVRRLVENSSGNTVASLAAIGRAYGIPETRAIVSREVSPGKLALLRLFGVDVTIHDEPLCPDPSDPASGIHRARTEGDEDGSFNPGQYGNEANPSAHEQCTGPELWQQLGAELTVLCAGLGTTGTLVGTARSLRPKIPALHTVGVVRAPNNQVPGVRTETLLGAVSFDWRGAADAVIDIGTRDACEKSLQLVRIGLLAGPSSGLALAGLLAHLTERKAAGTLDALRNANGEVVAVFICPDLPFAYAEEYFEVLGEEAFPPIVGGEMLEKVPPLAQETSSESDAFDIAPQDALACAYDCPALSLWETLGRGTEPETRDDVVLVDTRPMRSWEDARLPGSIHIPFPAIMDAPERHPEWHGKTILLLCSHGVRTRAVAALFRKRGLHAMSIRGGMDAWSRLMLPRVRDEACLRKVRDA